MNPPREPRIAGLLALPFALLFMNGAIAAERVPLDRVVEALQADGTVVVYSAALVDSGLELELTDLTPEAIDVALRPLRLTLVREGNYWLIAPLPDPPAVRLRLRSHSGAPIHSATLTTSEGVVTVGVDPEGFIDRQVARGTAVEVHTDGHWPLLATLSEPDQLLTLEPRLEPETVIVTGSQQHLPVGVRSGTAATVSADDLEARPALGGDSIRILTELPGMSSVGVSASPMVRGGLPDETLLRIDGVELIEPFHLADFQSLFSAVDDRTVESIDVYTGGFPARYGNRMSGVMEMSTAERPRTERTEIGLSMFALMANARGVSDDGAGWWLASARRGNLDLMIDRINSRAGSPKYWDAYGSVGRRLSDELEAAFGVLLSNDDVVFRDDAERARSAIDDRYAWMRLDAESGNLRGRTIIAIADSDRQKDQFSPDDDEDSAGFLDYSRDTSRVSAQSDWSLHRGATLVEFGGSIEYAEADYDASGLVNRGDMGELLGRPATEAIDIRTRVDGPTWGVYGSVDLPVTEHVSVQPGIRLDAQGYDSRGEKVYVSPRLGVEWLLDDAMTLRLAAGRFLQPEAPWELPVTDGVRAFDAVQRANHYVLALEWARDGWTLRADAYRKDYENPRRRFENIFDPFVILPELEPDRIAIAPDRARAQGVDLEARRAFGNGWIAGIALSDLDAEDRIEGTWVPRRWSQHHTARVLAAWKGERTQFAIAATWHSGWRTSALPSSTDEPFVIAEILNNDELKDYVALDLRLARTHRIGRAELTLYADLSNVLNRDNAAGVDYDVEEIDDGFAFVPDAETLLPFIPSLGFRLSF